MKTKHIISLAILSVSLTLFRCEEVVIEPTQPPKVDAWADRSIPPNGHQPRKEADPLFEQHD